MSSLYGFLSEEDGATAIEYALIAALISIVMLAALHQFSTAMSDKFSMIAASVTAAS